MNIRAILALLLIIIGWWLMTLMGVNLLSGPFENRTCLTSCVQTYYYSALAFGVISLILSALSFRQPRGRILSIIALLLSLALCGLVAMLFVAGNFF